MKREEVQMMGFEIVAYAGDARSKLLLIMEQASNGNFENVDMQLQEVDSLIAQAHRSQTLMLQEEAKGNDIPYSFTMIHGQDHLMTTMLLRDTIKTFMRILKRTENLEEIKK